MSVLSLCLNEIHNVIPIEILEEAFRAPFKCEWYAPSSIDSRIITEVFEKRVLPDLNLRYANIVRVPVSQCKVSDGGYGEYVITIPPEALNHRKIVSVLGINYQMGMSYGGSVSSGGNGSLLSSAVDMANASGGIQSNHNVLVEMIGLNSVRVRQSMALVGGARIEVVVENDPNLNNIPIHSTPFFQELSVLACKSYIYTKLRIKIGRAKLDAGSELGVFGDEIEKYADAEELYNEKRKLIARMGWLGDQEMKYDFLKMITGRV